MHKDSLTVKETKRPDLNQQSQKKEINTGCICCLLFLIIFKSNIQTKTLGKETSFQKSNL